MRVLVGCEFSGTVRDAFAALGHDAWSCDLLPTEKPGNHIVGNVLDVIGDGWDLAIFHPPCTYLCNSGVLWLYGVSGNEINNERWESMQDACRLFSALLHCRIPRVAVENPVMHGHAQRIISKSFSQSIQPWQFGHGETKRTCLWLRNLPRLKPTNIVDGREPKIHYASPSEDRWKIRSLTYPGIAQAMAQQWGNLPVVPYVKEKSQAILF